MEQLDAGPLMSPSNLCTVKSCTVPLQPANSAATLRAVLDAEQKNAGDYFHPICRALETTNLVGCPSCCGSTYAEFHSDPGATPMRQNPSDTVFVSYSEFLLEHVSVFVTFYWNPFLFQKNQVPPIIVLLDLPPPVLVNGSGSTVLSRNERTWGENFALVTPAR